MVFFISVILAFLTLHATANANDGPYFNCSQVVQGSYASQQEACIATGYCVWNTIGGQSCVYDKCIKYVADDGGNPCDAQGGVECKLFYITDLHDCDTGDLIQTDRYCRENSSAVVKSGAFDKCFYDDLKNRETNSGATSCGKRWCNMTTVGSSIGQYCSQIGAEEDNDCSTYFEYVLENGIVGDIPGLCGCLGTAHCDLYPDCMVTGSGSSQACVADPCSVGTPQTVGQPCITVGSAQNCITIRRQRIVNNAVVDQLVCGSSTNDKANECFFAYNYSKTQSTKFPDYPECTVVQQNEDVCGLAFTFKSDGSNDPDKKCFLEPIAAGYFPFPQYCTDGDRTVPKPDKASVLRVPAFLLAAILSLIYFL